MSIKNDIDSSRHIVHTYCSDVLTDADLQLGRTQLLDGVEFGACFTQIIDTRDVTSIEITSEGIRRIAYGNPFGAGSRRALVSNLDAVFGMARMFETVREDKGDEFRVFRSWDEAIEWLGIDPNISVFD